MRTAEAVPLEMAATAAVETAVILSQRRRHRYQERSCQRYRNADAIPDSYHVHACLLTGWTFPTVTIPYNAPPEGALTGGTWA
jgi:hypothetical protein